MKKNFKGKLPRQVFNYVNVNKYRLYLDYAWLTVLLYNSKESTRDEYPLVHKFFDSSLHVQLIT